jgi:hypothetical protein
MLALATTTMTVAAACSSSDPGPEPTNETGFEEGTAEVTQAFALTPQCAQCSATAVAGPCGQAAQQCLQDPNCADVSGCVQACPPNDPICLANCYNQASQALDVLAECVVCQECPVECAGAWQCGGGGGGNGGTGGGSGGSGGMSQGGGGGGPSGVCDNQGQCQACVACAVQGPCQAVIDACLQDPQCLSDPQQLGAAFECAACTECANDCANQTPPIPGLSCP